jgi:hypothetical protein
MGDENLRL